MSDCLASGGGSDQFDALATAAFGFHVDTASDAPTYGRLLRLTDRDPESHPAA